MSQVDLNTPVGRRAVSEAAREALLRDGDEIRAVIQAALAVLTSDVCPVCDGDGATTVGANMTTGAAIRSRTKPCPDCVNGKVKPALYTREQFLDWLLNDDVMQQTFKKHRAEVIAEEARALRDHYYVHGLYKLHGEVVTAAEFIERRVREHDNR